ncbi:hypothetical protein C1645_111194 [Glomus cerebriforme]|uniref:DUF7721 domain-containing protein n=1 Tax=Glomus cerebriforme TaxID=658196 RepID=A0A397S4A2_9GLOM|nr:hypothetical protein C1645_111194 [Glomus cerebriforme]
MSLFDDLKKKFLDDKDEGSSSSFADKFKLLGHSDEDAAIVQNVAHKAQQKANDEDDDDDDELKNAHKKIYEHDDNDHDDKTLGKAAAFEALKKYYTGKKSEKDKTELQKQFVALAISEGLEIWKKKKSEKGEDAVGKKEEIMEQAATAAMKLLAKSEKSEGKTEVTEGESEEKSSHSKLTDLAKKFF